jgi:hypothetical protein
MSGVSKTRDRERKRKEEKKNELVALGRLGWLCSAGDRR